MKKLFLINESERERILNMHTSATSRQYLNEQQNDILTPNEMAEIAKRIGYLLAGDVKVEDLDEVSEILENEVFGKKASESECALSRVDKYIKRSRFADKWMSSLFLISDYQKNNLYKKINDSKEWSEPQFKDVKNTLLQSIKDETNGFCKRVAEQSEQSAEKEKIKQDFYDKLPCLKDEEFVGIEKGKNTNRNYFKFKKAGLTYAVDYVDLILYVLNNNKWDKKGSATCQESKENSGPQLNEGIGYVDSEQNKIVEIPDSPTQPQDTENKTQQGKQNTPQKQEGSKKLLRRGVKDDEVLGVKARLKKELPNIVDELGIDVNNNTYDGDTVAAVAYFQAKNNLKVDGIVGPETRGALSKIQIEDAEGGTDA